MLSSVISNYMRVCAATQRQLKKVLGNGKKAVKPARMWRMLPIFIALTLAVCLVPLFRASAANPSSGAFSATGLFSQFDSSYGFLPSLAARFAPQDDPPEDPNSDLGVTKLVVGSDNVGADSNVTYSIEVRNSGPDVAPT